VQLRAIELESSIYARRHGGTTSREMGHRGRPTRPLSRALTGIHFRGLRGQRRARSMTSFKSRSAVARVVATLPGALRKRNLQRFFRVRGARSVVAVGCWLRTTFTGGVAPESQPRLQSVVTENDGIRDER